MEKDYLGFDYKVKVTDKDIAFLLDVTNPSEIAAKIDDEQLNKISEFYNGKFITHEIPSEKKFAAICEEFVK